MPVAFGQREEAAPPDGAGIIDQDVEPADIGDQIVGQGIGSLFGTKIGRVDGRLAAASAHFCRDALERRAIACGKDDMAASAGEFQRDASSDAATATGDERNFTVKGTFHSKLQDEIAGLLACAGAA